MRFEAKHRYFTQLAHGMKNFKNLSKTLAIRHQRLQCYWLCEEDAYLKPVEETGSGDYLFVFLNIKMVDKFLQYNTVSSYQQVQLSN